MIYDIKCFRQTYLKYNLHSLIALPWMQEYDIIDERQEV